MLALKLLLAIAFICGALGETAEEEHGVIYANHCEACKILATELQERLTETGKTHEVLHMGYNRFDDKPKKSMQYRKSETRFIESTEDVCEQVLRYNLHKERKDSTRFAKGMSQTFQTLHGLVDRGVKVDLGIPLELWDKPPAEVTELKTQCETLLERYEPVIEDWYNNHQEDDPLIKFLCEDRVLSKENAKCLYEIPPPPGSDDEDKDEKDDKKEDTEEESSKKHTKGDKGDSGDKKSKKSKKSKKIAEKSKDTVEKQEL